MLRWNPLSNQFDFVNDFSADTLHVLKAGDTMTGPLVINSSSTKALETQDGSGNDVISIDTTVNQMVFKAGTKQDGGTLGTNLQTSQDFTNATFWNTTGWTATSTTAAHNTGNTTALSMTTSNVAITSALDYLVTFTVAGVSNNTTESLSVQIGGSSPASVIRGNGTFKVGGKANSTNGASFTPTSGWDGTISVTSVQLMTNSVPRMVYYNKLATAVTSEMRTGFLGGISWGLNSGRNDPFTGSNSFIFGTNCQQFSVTGANNVMIGDSSGSKNVSGSNLFLLGGQSGTLNVSGSNLIAIGIQALASTVQSSNMIAIGNSSLLSHIGTVGNITAIGIDSGRSDRFGHELLFIGSEAGYRDPSATAWVTLDTLTNAGAIGYAAQVQASNALTIGGQGVWQLNTGFGTTSPTNFISASPTQYSTGTASQSTTTITGSGTTWTAAMVGSEFIYANGTKTTITGFGSATSLTAADSLTVASQIYRIHRPVFQVDGTNFRVGVNNAAPTVELDVVGDIKTSGKLNVTTGNANSSAGIGTLSGGTATIATTAVTTNSLIFLTDTGASLTNVGALSVTSKTAGTGFTVGSTNVLDSSTFNWLLIN